MKVGSITSVLTDNLPNKIEKSKNTQFENVFTDLINNVNEDQLNADAATKNFVLGENVELHDVMIAAEKAKTSLELLMEIRNKAVDMYKELTRIEL